MISPNDWQPRPSYPLVPSPPPTTAPEPLIVGFCGLKGSGKTTAAEILVSDFEFTRFSFARVLKNAVQEIFGFSDYQMTSREAKEAPDPFWEISPREALQTIGVQFREMFGEDFWIQVLSRNIDRSRCKRVVLDDVRFPNEADWVRSRGGLVVGLKRNGTVCDGHVSESAMVDSWSEMVDVEVFNNAHPDALARRLESVLGFY